MARTVNTALQDLFLENYFKATGNVSAACERTKYHDGKKERTLSRETAKRWFKDKRFLKKLHEVRLRWRDDLFRVAMSEATGSVKTTGKNEFGQDVVLERNRPVAVLLMFLMKSMEPEKYDDAYRIQLLKQEGSARLFEKYPLPHVVYDADPMPERFKADHDVNLPKNYTTPPPRTKQNTFTQEEDPEIE